MVWRTTWSRKKNSERRTLVAHAAEADTEEAQPHAPGDTMELESAMTAGGRGGGVFRNPGPERNRPAAPLQAPAPVQIDARGGPWCSMWEAVPRYHPCWAFPCATPLGPRTKQDLNCRWWAAERRASSSLRRVLPAAGLKNCGALLTLDMACHAGIGQIAVMNFLEILDGAEVLSQSGDCAVKGLDYDSRRVQPGWVFVAMRGESTDGNRYIDAAIAAGAVAVVTDSADETPREGVAWAVVPHGTARAGRLSANFYKRPAERLRVTGITGTNGKTTTTFIVESILRAAGRKNALVGTVEYHLPGETLPAPHTTPEALELNRCWLARWPAEPPRR